MIVLPPWAADALLMWAALAAARALLAASHDLCRGNPYSRPEDDHNER